MELYGIIRYKYNKYTSNSAPRRKKKTLGFFRHPSIMILYHIYGTLGFCDCLMRGKNNKNITPRKTHMELENHPFEQEKHLNQIFMFGFNMLNFGGVHPQSSTNGT